MDSVAGGKDSGADAGATGPATGGSIEELPRIRQVAGDRSADPGRADAGTGRDGRLEPGVAVSGGQETELGRRIRRMYLISARSEYRLLAQPQRVAFRDMGRRLVTEHDDPNVVRGMLDVVQHKGWERVSLAGSETFRRLAWLEARSRGLETIGYVPSREDRQRLAEWLAERDGGKRDTGGAAMTGAAGDRPDRGGQRAESRGSGARDPGGAALRPRAAEGSVDERDAVVLAVADEVLCKRRVGETTRARVAEAISSRLAQMRAQGINVSVRMHDGVRQPHGRAPADTARPERGRTAAR